MLSREAPVLEVKASVWTYITFGVIFGIPLIIDLSNVRRSGLRISLVCLICMGLCFLWLSAYRLRIANGAVTYRSLIGGIRSLALSDIGRAQIRIGVSSYTDRFRPTARLVLEPRPESNSRPVSVNMGVFSKQSIDQVLAALGPLVR